MFIDKYGICPICHKETKIGQYKDDVNGILTVVESYENCTNCSFISRMCYSKPFSAILETEPQDRLRRAKELDINILSEEEYNRYLYG